MNNPQNGHDPSPSVAGRIVLSRRECFEKLHQLSVETSGSICVYGLKIPRPDKESVDLFQSLVPKDDRVAVRPTFGNISAFVNGNMFFGVFGNDLFVRLSSEDQLELLDRKSTRLNSSHLGISYAVFCLKKKKKYKHRLCFDCISL